MGHPSAFASELIRVSINYEQLAHGVGEDIAICEYTDSSGGLVFGHKATLAARLPESFGLLMPTPRISDCNLADWDQGWNNHS